MAFPLPTPVARKRDVPGPLPTLAPLYQPAALLPRCEDCLTTTVTRTYYVDEYGQSTTCTTTQYQTDYQTIITSPTAAPQPTTLPTPTVQTVYHTMTSTIQSSGSGSGSGSGSNSESSSGSDWSSPAPSSGPATWPGWQQSSGSGAQQAGLCSCGQQWTRIFLGGIPHGAAEVMASLAFFFPFLLFFLVALIRLKTYAGDKDMFFFLLPLTLFLATMLSAMATRAYAANNESTSDYLAQYVMTALAIPMLMEVSLQLYGFLSKRAIPSGWIDATSLFFRFMNIVAIALYAVAAGTFVSFVNNLTTGLVDCTSSTITRINVLNVVADILELLILIGCCICLFLARWRLRMELNVLIIQYLISAAFAFHFVWRFLHEINSSNYWMHRTDSICNQGGTPLPLNWSLLRDVSNGGMNGTPVFWLLGILPIFVAATLLMAANLVRYVTAVPEPVPEADSVRYKLCYNENTKKMEFQRLDNCGGPILPSGEQLYELVRDSNGEGWAIQEARIPTVQPAWQDLTFSPWYR